MCRFVFKVYFFFHKYFHGRSRPEYLQNRLSIVKCWEQLYRLNKNSMRKSSRCNRTFKSMNERPSLLHHNFIVCIYEFSEFFNWLKFAIKMFKGQKQIDETSFQQDRTIFEFNDLNLSCSIHSNHICYPYHL